MDVPARHVIQYLCTTCKSMSFFIFNVHAFAVCVQNSITFFLSCHINKDRRRDKKLYVRLVPKGISVLCKKSPATEITHFPTLATQYYTVTALTLIPFAFEPDNNDCTLQ